jgi:hypothetical protein
MDEEDGRPGARARKFGPHDVLTDVWMGSLCRPSLPEQACLLLRSPSSAFFRARPAANPTLTPRPFLVADLPKAFASSQVEEEAT